MLEVYGAAGSSEQHELLLSLRTGVLNGRTSKELAATAQPGPMSQSGPRPYHTLIRPAFVWFVAEKGVVSMNSAPDL